MDIQIGTPSSIWLLAVVAAGLVLTGYAIIARRRAALKFATARLRSQILPPGTSSRHWFSAILITASMTLLCLATMDIRWGKTWREVPQKGIEVMFVLDVSRSMLAEDVTPNRLGRAKQQIKDMVDEMAGDRVGLVVFAGDTRQSVPLTSHYEDFKQTLDAVGPHTVRHGGSRLGDALKAAANGFITRTNDHKAIVVFTDGEDQESKPDEVAKQIHTEQGIRVFTVGLGDMSQGARIPETEDRRGGFVQYDGQQVWSKMNGQILSQIATDTDGAYIPAGTRSVNMAEIYHGYVANVEQTEFETAKINAYIARYQWFAAPALVLLLLEVWISTRATRIRKTKTEAGRTERIAVPAGGQNAGTALRSIRPVTTSYLAAAVIALAAAPASAQSLPNIRQTANEINAANSLLRDGRVDEALEAYRKVVPTEQQRDELNYNIAVAEYRKGNMETAEQLFTDVAGTSSTTIAADSRYNLGNCQYAKALQAAEKDKPAAIDLLREAISNYRGALRGKPANPDARANIELAGELIRQLEREQNKEEEQKKQDEQQQQDQQDKSQDSESQKSDSQNDESQKNEPQENNDQQKNEEQMDEEQKKQDEQSTADQSGKDEQKKDEQENEKSGDEQEKNDPQNPSEQQAKPQNSDSRQTQQQNMQQQSGDQQKPDDEGQPEEQDATNQPVPTGDLKAAGEQEEDKKSENAVSMPDPNAREGLMTREEALKMLQSVRDRDMLRRMQQQRQERSRRVPVDKDW